MGSFTGSGRSWEDDAGLIAKEYMLRRPALSPAQWFIRF
jgi:hypothetical protein